MLQIKKIAIDIWNTILRFPIPIVSALLAFIFFFIENHFNDNGNNNYLFIKLALECVSGISYFIAVDLFVESKQVDRSKKIGLYLLGFCMLGLHFYSITSGMFDSESVFISRYLIFISCFHLLVSFAAFYKKNENQNFWEYNYFLFISILTSLLYSTSIFLGLAGALWAIEKMFKIRLSLNIYTDLFLFIFLIFNTISFLFQFPKAFHFFSIKRPFKKSIRIFVQYILLPILGIYLIILYLFLFNIILTGNIPSGQTCIPILIFSILGILAYLLIFPIRKEKKYQLTILFSNFFFYLLLPLLTLYFVAIFKRILPYGITEDRYLVFVLGVWLLVISLYVIFTKNENIMTLPMSLFVILFISAIGPWGMFQLSIQNQVRRLEFLLTKNKMLVNNKLISPPKTLVIPSDNIQSIRSILKYLNKRGQINQIHKWLDENDQKILNDAILKNQLSAVNAIFTNVHEEDVAKTHTIQVMPTFRFVDDFPINTIQYKNILSFSNIENPIYKRNAMVILTQRDFYITYQNDTLFSATLDTILNPILYTIKKNEQSEFDYNKLNHKIFISKNEEQKTYIISNDTLICRTLKAKLYFNKLILKKNDTLMSLHSVEGYLTY